MTMKGHKCKVKVRRSGMKTCLKLLSRPPKLSTSNLRRKLEVVPKWEISQKIRRTLQINAKPNRLKSRYRSQKRKSTRSTTRSKQTKSTRIATQHLKRTHLSTSSERREGRESGSTPESWTTICPIVKLQPERTTKFTSLKQLQTDQLRISTFKALNLWSSSKEPT